MGRVNERSVDGRRLGWAVTLDVGATNMEWLAGLWVAAGEESSPLACAA